LNFNPSRIIDLKKESFHIDPNLAAHYFEVVLELEYPFKPGFAVLTTWAFPDFLIWIELFVLIQALKESDQK